MGRSASHTGSYPFDGRILLEQYRHVLEVLSYAVRVGLCRQVVFHDELFVVEIGEEEVFHPCHSENTECQNSSCGNEGRFLVSDQEADASAHEAVNGRIVDFLLSVLFLFMDG